MKLSLAFVLAFLPFINADSIKEPKGSKVSVLNKDLFPRFISRSSLVLMEWYTPWCGHCQELAPIYREAANVLAEMKKNGEIPQAVKFAKMNDGDEYNQAARYGAPENYNFSGYPALFIFKDGNLEKPEPYWGGREVDDMVAWMSAVAKGLDPIEEEKKARPGLYKSKTTDVLELSTESFNATVKLPSSMQNNVVYIVEFYSDRCPYCKILSPEVIQASVTLQAEEPRAVIAACNTRIYDDIAEQNGITGYPWVAAFYNGKKVEDMAGLGGADSIVQFAKRMVNTHHDASFGETPPRMEVVYEDGVLQLEPFRQEWFQKDKLYWEDIEAQKLAGTYVEPEPEPVTQPVEATSHPEPDAQEHIPPPPPEVVHSTNEVNQQGQAQVNGREELEARRRAAQLNKQANQHRHGHVLNPDNVPPPPDAKIGPMMGATTGDAKKETEKMIADYEKKIDEYRVEAEQQARKNIYGSGRSEALDDVQAVEVNMNGAPVSQDDIDKGAQWRATLGRQTWFFLHTLAAKYPEYPSEIDQRAVRNLVASLGQLYPCKLCRKHLRLKLMEDVLGPVRTENRTALSTWFCELHNMVNVDTGKTHYHDCSPFNLDLQYLKDCGECEGPGADKQNKANRQQRGGGFEISEMEQNSAVFDARSYAKDEAHYASELSEAIEALTRQMYVLDQENILLKKAWPSGVPRPV